MKKEALHRLFKRFESGGFIVEYWDEDERKYGNDTVQVKLVFNEPPTVADLLSELGLAFGEAYMDGIIDFEGEMEDVLSILEKEADAILDDDLMGRAAELASDLSMKVDKKQQKDDIQHHYDLGNDFFSLWLDDTMSYSCAYFRNENDNLKQAQMQKIDHVLRKLQLQPGEKLLDIGSGWGSLALRAADKYGVQALGITLSEEQAAFSEEKAAEAGLDDLVQFRLQDYLDLDKSDGPFDKIVSVGMFEHVGKENLPRYMDKVNELLADGGLSALHSICGMREEGVNPWIRKYIFPGGYIPSLREILWLFPDYDFHLIHAESLRLHYAMTLQRWHENFRQHVDEVEEMFDRRFVRMWDLYLRGCAASFKVTGLDVYQLLFSKGLNNQLNLTFDHLYPQSLESFETDDGLSVQESQG